MLALKVKDVGTSTHAAGCGGNGKRDSVDLSVLGDSVVRELLNSAMGAARFVLREFLESITMQDDPSVAVRVTGLAKRYRSGASDLSVFSGLNLEVARGERLSLVGESGAGKSSLLHLLGGLDRPTEGTIYFGQQDIARLSEADLAEFRNREIGFVWQIQSLLAEFTALENVMMPLLIRGVRRADAAPVSLAGLDEVGLRNRASHRAGELSGGEQQRVVLARALMGSPSVLLADEPTGNLDFKTGEMIMTLLEDLHRTHRLTSIYVTHNLSFARRGDRVLKLENGALAGAEAYLAGAAQFEARSSRLEG
ncbi:MAG: ABC transporter ATP-binding protein [Bryobacteraceae bacterium]